MLASSSTYPLQLGATRFFSFLDPVRVLKRVSQTDRHQARRCPFRPQLVGILPPFEVFGSNLDQIFSKSASPGQARGSDSRSTVESPLETFSGQNLCTKCSLREPT